MRLLVTGGAGYIGAIVARRLREAGHAPLILDDLSAGHREAAGADLSRVVISHMGAVGDVTQLAQISRLWYRLWRGGLPVS